MTAVVAVADGTGSHAGGVEDQTRGGLGGVVGEAGSTLVQVSAVSTMLEWPSIVCTILRSLPVRAR